VSTIVAGTLNNHCSQRIDSILDYNLAFSNLTKYVNQMVVTPGLHINVNAIGVGD